MNKYIIPILLIFFSACESKKEQGPPVLKKVDYAELKKVIEKNDDVLYLVNFWATWCKPCVEELPHFMEVNQSMIDNDKFKMILVSMDKSDQLETGVKNMIEQKHLETDVYLLDDPTRMNEWITSTDKNWSGSIPATVLYKNGKSVFFHEGQLSKKELEHIIEDHL